MFVLKLVLVALHLLSVGGWFGAMCYSLFVLQPRAARYFKSLEELEEFTAAVSQGARWKVLPTLATIAITGAGLMLISAPVSRVWWILVLAKSTLFLVALGIFCYASWWLWPKRIFAIEDEIPSIRRQFRFIGITLIAIAAISIVLGVAASLGDR